jgi:hypothetical protein
MDVRRDISPLVEANKKAASRTDAYAALEAQHRGPGSSVRVRGRGVCVRACARRGGEAGPGCAAVRGACF